MAIGGFFYEYAANDASLIGLALGDRIAGPWSEQPPALEPPGSTIGIIGICPRVPCSPRTRTCR